MTVIFNNYRFLNTSIYYFDIEIENSHVHFASIWVFQADVIVRFISYL